MLKALITGFADMAQVQAEPTDQEPIRRVCAYIEAVAAGLLIMLVAMLLLRGA